MAIITVADLKAFSGSAADKYDAAQLAKAVAAINLLLPRQCHRVFDLAIYHTWMFGRGAEALPMPNYPITQVYQATSQTISAMQVNCVSATGNQANASLNSAAKTLFLTLQGGVGAFAGPAIDLTSLATMALLKVAIEVLSPTLTATVMQEGIPSALKPLGAVPFLSPAVLYLELPVDSEDCTFSDRVLWKSIGRWPGENTLTYVWYEAGYSTMPDDLQTLACRIAMDLLELSQTSYLLNSERLGDWSWTVRPEIQELLARYRQEINSWRRIEP